jgi:plastocyanin
VRHLIPASLIAAATALLLAGCGGGSSPTASAPAQPAPAKSASAITIDNFKFSPAEATARPGARVTVANHDSTTHTLTADDGHSFDTGDVDPNQSATITVSRPGRYAYHCSIHSFMKGELVVK